MCTGQRLLKPFEIPCKIFTNDAPNMVETIKGKDRQ